MTVIGHNDKEFGRNIILGKKLGDFETLEKAREFANANEGSEILYKATNDKWHVNELKEEGIVWGTNNLSEADTESLNFAIGKMKEAGIKNPIISFVDDTVKSDLHVVVSSSDSNLSPEILKQLSEKKDLEVRGTVAGNPKTSAETLKQLSTDNSDIVREIVAGNPKTPAETLKKLSTDNSDIVREIVAGNPKTPAETLKELSTDNNYNVRVQVAHNPKTPVRTLKQLLNDSASEISAEATKTLKHLRKF